MSNQLKKNWTDLVLHSGPHERLNKHSDDVIKIINFETSPSTSTVLEKNSSNPQVALIGQNQVTLDVFIVHHVEEASGGIGSSFRSLVCSQGWGSKEIPIQINSCPLNDGLNIKCPSK